MPLEIRELVIQAQIEDDQLVNNNTVQKDATEQRNIEELEELINAQVSTAFEDIKEALLKEMKHWVQDYISKQGRRY